MINLKKSVQSLAIIVLASISMLAIATPCVLSDYQPIVGKGTIVSWYWASTGGFYVNIEDQDVAVVKVRQDAPVGEGGACLVIVPFISAEAPVAIVPSSDAWIISEGEIHTFRFAVKNLGADIEMELTITFEVVNDLGTVTDTKQLDFKLLKRVITSETTIYGTIKEKEETTQPSMPLEAIIFILSIATIVFLGTTIYFARKKPKGNYNQRSRGS